MECRQCTDGLVEPGAGGAELTREGKLLIENYRHMTAEIEKYTETAFDKYFGGDWLNRE